MRLSIPMITALDYGLHMARFCGERWVKGHPQTCEALLRRGLVERYWVANPITAPTTYYRLTDYGFELAAKGRK